MARFFDSNTFFWLFIGALLTLSAYFAISVETFRGQVAKARLAGSLESGQEVVFEGAVDGDEILVATPEGERFVVRILGIKVFTTSSYEPGITMYAQSAKMALETYQGQTVALVFEDFERDRQGRVLAYVEKDGVDIGASLLENGQAIVYTLYPFSREQSYLTIEQKARALRRGLWESPKASGRAAALKASWSMDREER